MPGGRRSAPRLRADRAWAQCSCLPFVGLRLLDGIRVVRRPEYSQPPWFAHPPFARAGTPADLPSSEDFGSVTGRTQGRQLSWDRRLPSPANRVRMLVWPRSSVGMNCPMPTAPSRQFFVDLNCLVTWLFADS